MTDDEFFAAAITDSELAERFVGGLTPPNVSREPLPFQVGASLVVMLQLHRSIRLLVQEGDVDAAAAALFRPYLEPAYKILWLIYLAKPERVRQIDLGAAHYPKLTRLLAEQIAKKSKRDIYRRQIEDLDMLHELTHIGAEQLNRQYSQEHGLKAQRNVREIATIVDRTAVMTQMVFIEALPILKL